MGDVAASPKQGAVTDKPGEDLEVARKISRIKILHFFTSIPPANIYSSLPPPNFHGGRDLKKTTRVVALCLLVFVAYSSLLALNPLRSFAQRYHKAVVLNLRILYSKYTAADLKLDTDETFQRSLDEIAASKFASGDFPELSFINPGYAPPTALSVPSYYHTSAKPQVQPFDPRFTLSAYLHWIRVHPNEPVPFHWSDWVDLHALNNPTKLVFMTNNHGSYIVDVKDNDVNDYRNALLTNGMVEEILSEVNSDSWDVLDAYDKLLKTRPHPTPTGLSKT
ncbi:hypothetical protein CJJ09_003742 [Candidozyma auris]|nr:hypothetical protein CJJ09_003742 [[Candida] auris]